MSWLVGHWASAATVAVKAALLYLTALVGLRLTVRRVLAQLTVYDVVAMVSIGAVVGRTATAQGTSFVQGAVALVVLLGCHEIVNRLRLRPGVRRLTDHKVRVLVADGEIDRRQLKRCQLTEADLRAALRIRGIASLSDVRYVIYEAHGALSVVRGGEQPGDLVRTVLTDGRE